MPYEDRVGVFLCMLQSANSVAAQLQDARDALAVAEEQNKSWSVLQNANASYARARFVTTTSRKSVQQIRQTSHGQDKYYQHGVNFDQIEVDEDEDCWNRRGQDPEPFWQASSCDLAYSLPLALPCFLDNQLLRQRRLSCLLVLLLRCVGDLLRNLQL